jgi:hypothetical protein
MNAGFRISGLTAVFSGREEENLLLKKVDNLQ